MAIPAHIPFVFAIFGDILTAAVRAGQTRRTIPNTLRRYLHQQTAQPGIILDCRSVFGLFYAPGGSGEYNPIVFFLLIK